MYIRHENVHALLQTLKEEPLYSKGNTEVSSRFKKKTVFLNKTTKATQRSR